MATASRDSNRVTTLIGVSVTDYSTPTTVAVDPVTHRMLVQSYASSGSGAPNTTPSVIGQMYVDTANAKVYIATGTSSSASWTIMN